VIKAWDCAITPMGAQKRVIKMRRFIVSPL